MVAGSLYDMVGNMRCNMCENGECSMWTKKWELCHKKWEVTYTLIDGKEINIVLDFWNDIFWHANAFNKEKVVFSVEIKGQGKRTAIPLQYFSTIEKMEIYYEGQHYTYKDFMVIEAV